MKIVLEVVPFVLSVRFGEFSSLCDAKLSWAIKKLLGILEIVYSKRDFHTVHVKSYHEEANDKHPFELNPRLHSYEVRLVDSLRSNQVNHFHLETVQIDDLTRISKATNKPRGSATQRFLV